MHPLSKGLGYLSIAITPIGKATMTSYLKILVLPLVFFLTCAASAQESADVKVMVTDFNDVPQAGEQIWLVGQKSKKTFKGVSGKNGSFDLKLPGDETYEIKIKSIGQEEDYSVVTVPKLDPGQYYGKLELTIKFELPKTFTLNNVFFDTGLSTLSKASFKELNELTRVLELKPQMSIELAGHTDSIGKESSNMTLSQARADAVKKYLISKGIEAHRIQAVGYGETRPIADNGDVKGRQKNRRTEVHIIKN